MHACFLAWTALTCHLPTRSMVHSSRPQAAQGELGKAAADFRRLHAERAELLGQWEGVLEAVRMRDAAILEAGERRGIERCHGISRWRAALAPASPAACCCVYCSLTQPAGSPPPRAGQQVAEGQARLAASQQELNALLSELAAEEAAGASSQLGTCAVSLSRLRMPSPQPLLLGPGLGGALTCPPPPPGAEFIPPLPPQAPPPSGASRRASVA